MSHKKVFRFAPSPTGKMHIGNCRTAILNYFEALKNNGEFFLRIDDTDGERDLIDYEHCIYEDLKWLDIKYTNVIKQSERTSIYEEYFEKLKNIGRIYECFETSDELIENTIYDRRALYLSEEEKNELRKKETSYWRFLLKKNTYNIQDGILGKMSIHRNWSDPIIKRNRKEKSFTYNFTSAVDDHIMGVTDIIRAQEHFYNSTIQQEIIDALDGQKINFSHLPLIINSDGHKLSKREGALSICTLREEGYHPMAIISLCLSLGTSKNPLISSKIEEHINYFAIKFFSKSSPKFAKKELTEINSKILKILTNEQIKIFNFDVNIWEIIKNNIYFLTEYNKWYEILNKEELYENFQKTELLKKIYINNNFSINSIENIEEKRKFCIHLRLCLTGEEKGPELDKILEYKLKFPLIKKKLGL